MLSGSLAFIHALIYHSHLHSYAYGYKWRKQKIQSTVSIALFVLLNNVGYADNRCPPIILS